MLTFNSVFDKVKNGIIFLLKKLSFRKIEENALQILLSPERKKRASFLFLLLFTVIRVPVVDGKLMMWMKKRMM